MATETLSAKTSRRLIAAVSCEKRKIRRHNEDQTHSEDNVRKVRRGLNEENRFPQPVPIPQPPALHGCLVGMMNCDITIQLIH